MTPLPQPWRLQEFAEVTSTNTYAASLPVWSAVRADTQTAGRGRFDRAWVSDYGGLWLSAVVPCGPIAQAARELPLLAGLAVADALAVVLPAAARAKLRMRWPNDLMIGRRKLAGLLVDQYHPEQAVVGIGVNVANDPAVWAASLAGTVVTLRHLLLPKEPPTTTELAATVLAHLQAVVNLHAGEGMAALTPRINALWDAPRRVLLDLDGPDIIGKFAGVNLEGQLRLLLPGGEIRFYEPHQVRHLKELPEDE
jgi:BirA family biotin operon repressor/biotin-[acetyl-CoA-carboxylase] ligase